MNALTWPAQARLSRRQEFLRVRAEGTSIRTGFLRWFVLPGTAEARFGIRIPKANGSAVRRNRLRRILRENLRLRRPEFPPGQYLILMNVPSEIKDAELTPAVRAEIAKLLKRMGVGE